MASLSVVSVWSPTAQTHVRLFQRPNNTHRCHITSSFRRRLPLLLPPILITAVLSSGAGGGNSGSGGGGGGGSGGGGGGDGGGDGDREQFGLWEAMVALIVSLACWGLFCVVTNRKSCQLPADKAKLA